MSFAGRLGLQQRVIPAYRAGFLEALSKACQGGLNVFAGQPLGIEGITPVERLLGAKLVQARNWHFRDPSSALFLCWQRGFFSWLRDWQPDALVVEANPRYPATRLAIRWMHRRGRPVVGWGLGASELSGPLASLRRWERLSLLSSLDAVIAYSELGAEQYQALGLPSEKVYVASNAVAVAPSTPPLQRPGWFEGRPVVLFVGRLQWRKRIDLLLQACAGLHKSLQPRLVIVGDGPARVEFESLAQQIYPLAEFVGTKHGVELEPFFQQADLFILPGTGGLAMQQAMAHGLPVIVAQGDGTQDDLVRPGNGWQVVPENVQSLQDAMQDALSDPGRLRRMGEESYRIVKEEVNIETMVAVFERVLNRVIM